MAKPGRIWLAGLALALVIAGVRDTQALTQEQALEDCRSSVGRPFVQQCMGGNKGAREECRAKAFPIVHACVLKALNAANGRANVPLALPTEKGPSDEIAKQADALPAQFVAPPRTIADITAILDSEKPDPAKTAALKAEADVAIPGHASRAQLARFYYDRGNARAALGRLSEATDDANKALEAGRGTVDANALGRIEQFAGLQYAAAGDPRKALAIFQGQLRDTNAPGAKGYLFNGALNIVAILVQMGDIAQAEGYLSRSLERLREARTSGLPGWRQTYAVRGQSWEADVEQTRAILFEARGQNAEAEKSYRLAELRKRASIDGVLRTSPNPPPRTQMEQACDSLVIQQARMAARQGRIIQAEADTRRALLARLKDTGKYHTSTPKFVMGLAGAILEQGRYKEAEQLIRVAIEINNTLGVAPDSQSTVTYMSRLANVLSLQHKRRPAIAVYAEIDKAMANWDVQRREVFDLDGSRIYALYGAEQTVRGIELAEKLLKRNVARFGEGRYDTAIARGILAIGYMRAKRDADAAREFRIAIPLLLAAARENSDSDNATLVAARSDRLRNIVEAYIALLDRNRSGDSEYAAIETFALADAIRGQSVQRALNASSARMGAGDPALAGLVREEQDLAKRVNAQLGTLNNVLALPSGQRDETTVKALQVSIAKLRGDRDKGRGDIAKRFPRYADLIDPKPPSVEQIKAVLRPGEALLSFYFGREIGFVWAVPKDGKVAFAAIHASAGDVESRIRKLREALEPQAATIAEVPPFDLDLAYGLYEQLLKPVEAGWKPAKNLIVATNGALGLLPLSLLPTAPAKVEDGNGPLFAGYRNVAWLARTHAVSMVPSAAALRTLRQMPPGSPNRERMIGFGDPIFSKQAEAEQKVAEAPTQVAMATRGLLLLRRSSPKLENVDSAELAQLPALPDTAEELKSIAQALGADPSKALLLGVKANEEVVKATDLSRYKIIVFATHGLAAGELNGLTQPALALTAPDVAGIAGDGLLTMEEIISLKLDADWVVLSACNTGAAAGAGAEAASGLGQAFFYAGARALLVTNWSVDSQSAREITSELFRRQTANAQLSRSEALRESMMALLDTKGFTDKNGTMLFAYAHPLFWAPYSIIGDGGM